MFSRSHTSQPGEKRRLYMCTQTHVSTTASVSPHYDRSSWTSNIQTLLLRMVSGGMHGQSSSRVLVQPFTLPSASRHVIYKQGLFCTELLWKNGKIEINTIASYHSRKSPRQPSEALDGEKVLKGCEVWITHALARSMIKMKTRTRTALGMKTYSSSDSRSSTAVPSSQRTPVPTYVPQYNS